LTDTAPPRLYCLTAAEAPVVAVFRRGPSRWAHVGRWDLEKRRYEPGAWLSGRIFPRRSDLSPDGRLLCYFAHDPGATWEHGETYVAVSRLPWLTALHAFGTNGTWTRGFAFVGDEDDDGAGRDIALPGRRRLRAIPVVQFANERRRGWEEAPDSPPRGPSDMWDERRNARMRKLQPGGRCTLHVETVGWAGGEFGVEQAVDGMIVRYALEFRDDIQLLDDLQWADWDREGRLLAATRDGRLQIRRLRVRRLRGARSEILFEQDLSRLEPNPVPPPDWARRW